MDDEAVKKIAERFVRFVETGDPSDLLASDVLADVNVPEWRFQLQGADAVAGWLAGEQPNGCRVPSWRSDATASGAVVEVEQWYERDGVEISARNLHRLEVRDGRVTEWTMYCTGEWSPGTRERQAREAPMIKP
jgi:ketosteroid isomerase-like protein